MIKTKVRANGQRVWAWVQPSWPCRMGLHFMAWDFPMDAYTCPCGKQRLLAEEIR